MNTMVMLMLFLTSDSGLYRAMLDRIGSTSIDQKIQQMDSFGQHTTLLVHCHHLHATDRELCKRSHE